MTVEEVLSFGERLRRLREAAGLTQEELAERAGLTAKGIGALERGERKRPYPHTVRSLADALGLSLTERTALLAPPAEPTVAAPPPPAPAPTLAVPAEPLVGREREVAAIGELLGSGTRLLTLTGPGGVGKTRLALAAAAAVAERFPAGVALVALAPLGDAALVVPAMAHTLGLVETGVQSLRESLQSYLRDKQLLLVLDNFEHVLAASVEVAALLDACAELRVLVTSRAPLRLRAEREFPVGPLVLPELNRIPTVAEVASSPAVQLFVRRASGMVPEFDLSQANAAAVAAICRRLDGLPLALELAAAWVRLLSPTDLLARLDQVLPLLTDGAQDLPDRQRTMENTIRWSYDLLSPAEQQLFRRLSVLAGRWTLESAEALGAGGVVRPVEVLGLLMRLVEQSLVLAESVAGGGLRYRMLEPVRQFAAALLAESGEAEAIHRQHAAFFVALAERAHPEIQGPAQIDWLDRLETEHDNLSAAIGWSLAVGDLESAVRIGWALAMSWVMHNWHAEGRLWMDQVLARGDNLPPLLRAKALYALGVVEYGPGDAERLLALSQESADLFRQTGYRHGEALALGLVAFAAIMLGDLDRADAVFRAGLEIVQGLGDKWAAAHMLSQQAVVPLRQGDYDQAVRHAEAALALTRQTGERLATCVSQIVLGQATAATGDRATAVEHYHAAIELAASIHDRVNVAYCLLGLCSVAAAEDQPERAARLFAAAEALLASVGNVDYTFRPDRRLVERTVQGARTQLGEAAWTRACEEGRALTFEEAVAYGLQTKAESDEAEAPVIPPTSSADPHDPLTTREREVAVLIARGLTSREIAEALVISERTVDVHADRIRSKLGLRSRIEIAAWTIEHGLRPRV